MATLFNSDSVALASQKAPQAECWRCPLKEAPCAKTTGQGKIAFVSRSPGKQEALHGRSFSGPSGKVLDHLLGLYGFNRESVIATNIVLCQCEGVPEEAISACSKRLAHDLEGVDTIIAGGAEATKALAGFSNVYENRGVVHKFGTDGRLIITNNPAMVLRDERAYPDMVRDFRLALSPRPKHPLPTVKYTEDLDEANNWAGAITNQLRETPGIVCGTDIETRGRNGRTGLERGAQVVCAGFALNSDKAVVFGERVCTDEHFLRSTLGALWTIEGVRYLWHNGKYDCRVLRENRVNARVDEDTLLLSWALDERPGDPSKGYTGHSLEYLLKEYLGYPKYEPPSVKHFKKTGELPNDAARRDLYVYNGTDTAGTIGLHKSLRTAAELDNVLHKPYVNHLLPLNEALLRIELIGWLFNEKLACDMLEDHIWPVLRQLEAEARHLAQDPELNLNSYPQLENLFYEKWGLKHNLRRPKIENKGKRSTDKWVRKEVLEDRYESAYSPFIVKRFMQVLDRHSELDTQRGTYFEGLVKKQFPNGKVYYDFLIHGTETGRLSGRNPNMQNITRPKANLPPIRECFIAEPGHVILNCDLSQAELRAVAVFSGDTSLGSIYKETGRSLHKEIATEFYGENYTYEQYVFAKNINFGVVFDQSAFTFAQMYAMDQKEAQKFIDFWWARFPQIKEWTKSIHQIVLEEGELQSPFGHKRRFYLITDQNRDHIFREAVNFLPQNTATNLALYAMVQCALADDWDWEIAQPLINVHDSITLQVRREYVDEIANRVLEEMEAAPKKALDWDFPFGAEASYGPSWGQCNTNINR